MAQPRTQDQLVQSLLDQANISSTKVVGTLATRDIEEMTTSHRGIAAAALSRHLAVAMHLDEHNPGDTIQMNAQTDQYYITHDTSGAFKGLVAHIVTISVRTR